MSSGRGFRPCTLIHIPPFSSGGPHQRVTWTYPLLIIIINHKHCTSRQFVLVIFKQTGHPMLLNTINYKHWTWLSYTDYSRCNNTAETSTAKMVAAPLFTTFSYSGAKSGIHLFTIRFAVFGHSDFLIIICLKFLKLRALQTTV